MSRIHYKFKSSLDYSNVTFDGIQISLRDLKKAIMMQKKMKVGEFDLEIQNAQTKQVYGNEDDLIPKNSSVIVSRNPMGPATAPPSQPAPSIQADIFNSSNMWDEALTSTSTQAPGSSYIQFETLSQTGNLANAHATEDEKIKAMMHQSTKDFDPSQYKTKYPTGKPNSGYICYRCQKPGHFINECNNPPVPSFRPRQFEIPDGSKVNKRSTGIPMSFMETTTNPNQPGAYVTHRGQIVVPSIDAEAYRKGKKELPPFLPQKEPEKVETLHIPSELLCTLCKELLVDAVVIPCCGASFCDECIRNALLETEEHECPTCNEIDISPDRLITNKFLRMAVNNFKNDTGYTTVKRPISAPQAVAAATVAPPIMSVQRPVVQIPAPSIIAPGSNPASNPAITIPASSDLTVTGSSAAGLIPGQPMNAQAGQPPVLPGSAQSQPNPAISFPQTQASAMVPQVPAFNASLRQPGSSSAERPHTPPQESGGYRSYQQPNRSTRTLTTLVHGSGSSHTAKGPGQPRIPRPPIHNIPPPGAVMPPHGPPPLGMPPLNGAHIGGFPPPVLAPPRMVMMPGGCPLTEEQFYLEKKRLTFKPKPHRQRDIYESFANEIYKRDKKPTLEPPGTSAVKTGSRSRSKSPRKPPIATRSRSKSRSPSRARSRSRSLSAVRPNARPYSRSRSRSFSRPRYRSRSRSRSFSRGPRRIYSRSFSRSRSRSLTRYSRSFSKSPVRRFSPIRTGTQWRKGGRRGGRYRSPTGPGRRFSPQRYRQRGRFSPSPPRDDEFYRYQQYCDYYYQYGVPPQLAPGVPPPPPGVPAPPNMPAMPLNMNRMEYNQYRQNQILPASPERRSQKNSREPSRRDKPAGDGYSSRRNKPMEDGYSSRREKPMDDGYSNRREKPMDDGYSSRREKPMDDGLSSRREKPMDDGYSSRREKPMEDGYTSRKEKTEDVYSGRGRERANDERHHKERPREKERNEKDRRSEKGDRASSRNERINDKLDKRDRVSKKVKVRSDEDVKVKKKQKQMSDGENVPKKGKKIKKKEEKVKSDQEVKVKKKTKIKTKEKHTKKHAKSENKENQEESESEYAASQPVPVVTKGKKSHKETRVKSQKKTRRDEPVDDSPPHGESPRHDESPIHEEYDEDDERSRHPTGESQQSMENEPTPQSSNGDVNEQPSQLVNQANNTWSDHSDEEHGAESPPPPPPPPYPEQLERNNRRRKKKSTYSTSSSDSELEENVAETDAIVKAFRKTKPAEEVHYVKPEGNLSIKTEPKEPDEYENVKSVVDVRRDVKVDVNSVKIKSEFDVKQVKSEPRDPKREKQQMSRETEMREPKRENQQRAKQERAKQVETRVNVKKDKVITKSKRARDSQSESEKSDAQVEKPKKRKQPSSSQESTPRLMIAEDDEENFSPPKRIRTRDDEVAEDEGGNNTEGEMEVEQGDETPPESSEHEEMGGEEEEDIRSEEEVQDETEAQKVAKAQLLLMPPELSKWERDESDFDDKYRSPKQKSVAKKEAKKSLPKSIIESAEKVFAQKKPKVISVASSVILPRKSSPEKRRKSSPERHRDDRDHKPHSASHRPHSHDVTSKPQESGKLQGRKVYMDSGSPRKVVTSKSEKAMKITIPSEKSEEKEKKVDLREEINRRRQRKESGSHHEHSVRTNSDKSSHPKSRTSRTDSHSDSHRRSSSPHRSKTKSVKDVDKSKYSRSEKHSVSSSKENGPSFRNNQEEKKLKKIVDRKESVMDESKFVPDYNEDHSDEELDRDENESASDDSDSDSSSDDKKKHRKHKKSKHKKHKHKKSKKHKKSSKEEKDSRVKSSAARS